MRLCNRCAHDNEASVYLERNKYIFSDFGEFGNLTNTSNENYATLHLSYCFHFVIWTKFLSKTTVTWRRWMPIVTVCVNCCRKRYFPHILPTAATPKDAAGRIPVWSCGGHSQSHHSTAPTLSHIVGLMVSSFGCAKLFCLSLVLSGAWRPNAFEISRTGAIDWLIGHSTSRVNSRSRHTIDIRHQASMANSTRTYYSFPCCTVNWKHNAAGADCWWGGQSGRQSIICDLRHTMDTYTYMERKKIYCRHGAVI